PYMDVQLDAPEGDGFRATFLERFSFARDRFAGDSQLGGVPPIYFIDLLGEWVFVNSSDPQAPATRVSLTRRAVRRLGIDSSIFVGVDYFDDARGARLSCDVDPPGDSGSPTGAPKRSGCELIVQ